MLSSVRDAFLVWKGRGSSRVGFRIGSIHELKLYRRSLSGRTRVSGRRNGPAIYLVDKETSTSALMRYFGMTQ